MAALLSCAGVGKSFGPKLLFENLALTLDPDDRLGIIGPNGSGKSTLLKMMAGSEPVDRGEFFRRKGMRIAYVGQESEFPEGLGAMEAVVEAMADLPGEGYEHEAAARKSLSRAGISDVSVEARSLSGGYKKRLAIAAALSREPHLLLLDEPTNHLDLEGILWLESALLARSFACAVISHDRYFLERVASRMMEVDRAYEQGMLLAAGGYRRFLEEKQAYLEVMRKRERSLTIQVKRELEWLGRGPKARGGKAKHRKDSAGELIERLEDVRTRRRQATAELDFDSAGGRSKELLAAEGLAKSINGVQLFNGLDLILSPKSRLGLVGPNGSGKTTLLRILGGRLEPDCGTIKVKDGLKTVWFDQHRALDEGLSLRKALTPSGGDAVTYRGRSVHVNAWASRFLFRSEQLDLSLSRLSGGERARVLIARLMLQPADLLLLDEPTNDLDIPTLEVLEESLESFPGALVLVTHDRMLLERLCTRILGLDGRGESVFAADYRQWEGQLLQTASGKPQARSNGGKPAPRVQDRARKLSYMDQREWEGMEDRILEAEERLESCRKAVEDPAVASDASQLQGRLVELEEAQRQVDALYQRWSELETKLH